MKDTPSADTARTGAGQAFTRLFEASPAPFLVVKPDAPRFTIAKVNDAYLAATMRTREDVVGRGIFEAYPDNPDDPAIAGVSTLRASLERVLATRRPDALPGLKYDVARPDGTFEERWWSPVNSAVLDENGEVEAIIHFANDVTAEHRAKEALQTAEARMRLQKEAFQAGIDGASLKDSLNAMARLVDEETGGAARTAFYLADPEGKQLHPVWGAGNMPEAYLQEIDGLAIGKDSLACGLAVPAGKAVITPDVHDDPRWRSWAHIAEKYDYRGCWSFPVKTRDDKAIGTFAMYFRGIGEATAKDLALAEIVTQTAAVVISSHNDLAQRKQHEAALREGEERQAFLLKLNDALRDERGPDDVGRLATRMLAGYMGVDRGYICRLSHDQSLAWVDHEYHAPGLASVAGKYHFDDFPESLRGSFDTSMAIDDLRNDTHLTEHDKRAIEAMGMHAVLTGILRKGEQGLVWALVVGDSRARAWSEADRAVVEEATERTWTAMKRARAERALSESETRYRSVVELASDGIWLLDQKGRFVEVNQAACRMLGYSSEQYRELGVRDFIEPDEVPRLRALLDILERGGQSVDIWTIRHADGHGIPIESSQTFTPDGYWQIIGRDVSERQRVEHELQQRSEQFATLLRESPMGIYLVDAHMRLRVVNPAARETAGGGDDIIGQDFDRAMHKLWSPDFAGELVRRVQHTLETGRPYLASERCEKRSVRDAWYTWHIRRTVIPGEGDGVVCYLSDITKQVRARERQKLLLMEINHRVKNTLATVQSVAMQSLRNANTLEEGGAALESRLISLSKAHDVLTREHWEGGDLHEVVENTLSAYPDKAGASRFRVSGDGVRLKPKAVVSLSMALHELATNAVKYGALSGADGYVDIAWEIVGETRERRFRMRWNEHDGPPVHAPRRRGFGSRLIEQGLAMDMGGEVRLDFDPDGLVCRIDAPLDGIIGGEE